MIACIGCLVPYMLYLPYPVLSCAFRKACSAGVPAHEATHHLDVADLLKQYGKAPGVLDNRALEQACTAIMACQVGWMTGLWWMSNDGALVDDGALGVGVHWLLKSAGCFQQACAGSQYNSNQHHFM